MSEWIPVVAALAGAAIGGIIGYFATLATLTRAENSEKRNIILSKLEETHQVVRSIRQSYRETFGRIYAELSTGMKIPNNESKPLDIDRLAMLVDFYFPELIPATQILESARDSFGAILAKSMIILSNTITDNKNIQDDFYRQHEELDKACSKLLDEIAIVARNRIKI